MVSEKELAYKYATELKLLTFRDELDSLLTRVAEENWTHLHLVAELLRKESNRRVENRKRARIKAANFPQMKYMHELITQELPQDARTALPELETLDFIKQGRKCCLIWESRNWKNTYATALWIKAWAVNPVAISATASNVLRIINIP